MRPVRRPPRGRRLGLAVTAIALTPVGATSTGSAAPERPASADVRGLTGDVRDLRLRVESLAGDYGVARSGPETTVTVSADVLFAFDRADLTPRARTKLADVAQELRAARATGEVLVGGHADSRGSAAYNRSLSERRASRVSAALGPLVRGLPVTLRAQGFGDTRPVAPNTLPSGADTRRAARRTAG